MAIVLVAWIYNKKGHLAMAFFIFCKKNYAFTKAVY